MPRLLPRSLWLVVPRWDQETQHPCLLRRDSARAPRRRRQQQQIYAALPPYQVERATVKGHVFYVYKDEKAGVAYVGREQEYQRYHELAVQQQIAQNYYMAAEMDRAAAFGWYGAWGPRALWW